MKIYEEIDGEKKRVICSVTLQFRHFDKETKMLADGITELHKKIFPQEYYTTIVVNDNAKEQERIVTVLNK